MTTLFLAFFKRFKGLSPLFIFGIGKDGDREMSRSFFLDAKVLFFNVVVFFAPISLIFAQSDNQTCHDSLRLVCLSRVEQSFSEVSGYDAEVLGSLVKRSDSSSFSLTAMEPIVEYQKVSRGIFLRSIEVSYEVNVEDSIVAGYTQAMTDTLTADQFKRVRKNCDGVLAGTDPRFAARILWPSVFLTAGVAGIISLFYMRSN